MKIIIPKKFTSFKNNKFEFFNDPKNASELNKIIANTNNEYIFNSDGLFSSGNMRKAGHFNYFLMKHFKTAGKYNFNFSNFDYFECHPNCYQISADYLDKLEFNFNDINFVYFWLPQSNIKANIDQIKNLKINTNTCDFTIGIDNDNVENIELIDSNTTSSGKHKKNHINIKAARELKTLDLSNFKNIMNTTFIFSFINKDCKWILPKGIEIESWERKSFTPPEYLNVITFKAAKDLTFQQKPMSTKQIRDKYLKLKNQTNTQPIPAR